jgi:hypothetical protein
LRYLLGLLTVASLWCHAAAAQDASKKNAILLFSGPLIRGDFGEASVPFAGGFDGGYVFGAAYSRHFHDLKWGFNFGGEIGLAGRFHDRDSSGEFWGGVSIGHRGVTLGNFTVAPKLVAGVSAVNRPVGAEVARQIRSGGDATVLFYLGPELAFSHSAYPNIELVYRLHHRSGAGKILGNLREGYNANVIGIRYKF